MSDERDDEILGRALSRAIETQDPNETPYERSRLAVRPLRRGLPLWQTLGVAAALVLAVALGAWFTRPSANLPAAATTTPTPSVTATPAVTGGPQAVVPQYEPVWVYFTRDGLPPIGAIVNAHVGVPVTGADQRIGERLMALAFDTKPTDVPAGAVDPLASVAGTTSGSGGGLGIAVHVDGDLATLDFQLTNGWVVRGPSMPQQLVQQIVYTATEDVGVRRVLIREHGKTSATIDQLVITKPLTRDDVSGYATLAATGTTTFGGDDKPNTAVGASLISRDVKDGSLVRLTFEGRDRAANDVKANLPTIKVSFEANDGSVPHNLGDGPRPAYVLTVGFQWNSTGSSGGVGHVERVDRSPLRLIAGDFNTVYQFGLDDSRPWRAYMPDPQHFVIDIGGAPRAVSDRIAVYSPDGTATLDSRISRTFTLSGAARTFEANVVWRLKDSTQKVVATGHTTASVGTSLLWGTFSTQVTLPAVFGNVTLEVYEVSPKDGSEQGLVAIPLVAR